MPCTVVPSASSAVSTTRACARPAGDAGIVQEEVTYSDQLTERCRTHGIVENEVPADNPIDELAERRIRVGVGASGGRDHACEFE